MHTPRSRLAAVGALLLALLAVLAPAVSASAATPVQSAAEGGGCKYETHDEGEIHIKGCMRDERDEPPSPVEGVGVTLEDSSGAVIGEDVTDANGIFDIPLDVDPTSALGKEYVVKIDESTLPEGSGLRDPDKVSVDIRFTTTSDQSVIFPIGDPLPGSSGKLVAGTPAHGRRPGVLGPAGDGGPRTVDDLRHDRAHELRPRRADHLRRDRRATRSTSCPARSASVVSTSP